LHCCTATAWVAKVSVGANSSDLQSGFCGHTDLGIVVDNIPWNLNKNCATLNLFKSLAFAAV
jgi:hypothetical protein